MTDEKFVQLITSGNLEDIVIALVCLKDDPERLKQLFLNYGDMKVGNKHYFYEGRYFSQGVENINEVLVKISDDIYVSLQPVAIAVAKPKLALISNTIINI